MRTEIKSVAEQLSQASSAEEARELLESNKDSLTEEDLKNLVGGLPAWKGPGVENLAEELMRLLGLDKGDVAGANAIEDGLKAADDASWRAIYGSKK